MNYLLPTIIGIAALAFITMPLWSGAMALPLLRRAPLVISREQLELDRELGKIDEAEYEELNALLPVATPRVSDGALESLIGTFRRKKRVEREIEAEVLVARARKR